MLGGKKITGTAWTGGVFPAHSTCGLAPGFWGVALDLPPPASIVEGKKALPFNQAVLVAALVRDSGVVPPGDLPNPERISFRAASLAFMLLAPLDKGLSFAWELDEPVWLPNPKRKNRG
jgi:hypothetical protein